MVVADAEVHFAEGVFYADVVVEPVGNGSGLIVIEGETLAIASDRAAGKGAARHLQAGGTDGDTPGLEVGDDVGNAAGAVAGGQKHATQRLGKGHHGGAGDAGERVAHVILLAFVRTEKESLVFDDRAAEAAAVLLEGAGQLGRGSSVEIVAGVEHVAVAAKGERGAVQAVGAGLETDVDHRSRLPSIFRGGILLDVEFLDGINGQNGGGVSGNAGPVDDRLARVRFAVEQTFDEVGIVLGAQAIAAGGGEAASGIADNAGTKLQQVFVIAAVEGKIVDFLVAQGSAESGGRGVDQGHIAADFDGFVHVAGGERQVHLGIGGNLEQNAGTGDGLESLGFGANRVGAGREGGDKIVAGIVGGGGPGGTALHIGDDDTGPGDGGP